MSEAGTVPPLLADLLARRPEAITDAVETRGESMARVTPSALVDVCLLLRDDPAFAFDFLMDLTAVDYIGSVPRFEIVYHLYSTTRNHRLRLKVRVPEDAPRVPTVTTVWRGANWLERETYDLYGIQFEGHPNLKRIYLYEQFQGHPLRKDYPKEKRQPLVTRADVEPPERRRQEERERERYGRWQ